MICKVIDTIEKYRLLESVKSVSVGVSGGADSMCLLHILSSLKEKYGIVITAVHVNHNLRGEEALRDENLVRDYCREKGIDLTVFSVDISSLSEELGIGTEECGRKVRYECFEKTGCDAVAVAHSLSDSIETTVYNLLRGTGTKGLCGIPVKRNPNIIRPLIFCTREEIEAYCEKEGIPYITDSTNLTDDYTRNFIRHNIIPSFEKVNGSYAKNISNTCRIFAEENDFIERTARELIGKSSNDFGYDAEALSLAHPAVRKRAVHILLSEKMNKPPLHKHVEIVDSLFSEKCGKVEISSGIYAVVKNGVLSFLSEESRVVPWQTAFTKGKADTGYGVYSLGCDGAGIKGADFFDGGKISDNLILTSRKEGDRFTFKNRKVSKSLKKLFNEMKIPLNEREIKAVLRDGENIIWVEGVGVNAPYIPDENTEKIFYIKKEE